MDCGSKDSQSGLRGRSVVLTAMVEVLWDMLAGAGKSREQGNRCSEMHIVILIVDAGKMLFS